MTVDHLGPRWNSAALLIIDVQEDFLDDGAATVAGTSAVLPQLGRLAATFRAAGRPIVHIVRLYEPGGSDVDLPRRAAVEAGQQLVAPGSPGSQIPSAVTSDDVVLDADLLRSGAPQVISADEVIMFKPRWSAFHRTGLADWLAKRHVDTVVVAGCNLPNCPRATLFDASMRDLRSVLVTDAVSGTTPERLTDLAAIGVQLLDSTTVIVELKSAT